MTRTLSSGFEWHPDPDWLWKRIAALTPSNEQLKQWTKEFGPPQEWWDSDDDPFEPEDAA